MLGASQNFTEINKSAKEENTSDLFNTENTTTVFDDREVNRENYFQNNCVLNDDVDRKTNSTSSNHMSEMMELSAVLHWPNPPERKGKTNSTRMLSVIISTTWKQLKHEKLNKKRERQEAVMKRKEKRLENKEKKRSRERNVKKQ